MARDIIEEGREKAKKSIIPSESGTRGLNNGGDLGEKKTK